MQKEQYFIGDEVPLVAGATDRGAQTGPREVPVEHAASSRRRITRHLHRRPGGQRFAVNLAPDESRTLPLPIERLTSLGVPLRTANVQAASETPKNTALIEAAELEKRQKLWRWAIAAALLVLLLETLFAGRLSRAVAAANPAQT